MSDTAALLRAHGHTTVGAMALAVDLQVAAGEVVGLVGPNGAGKSATLAVLLGLLRLETGRVEIAGRVVDDGRAAEPPSRRGLAWVPQAPALLPRRRPLEQVAAFALDGPARDVAARALRRVGLDPDDTRRPDRLSGGQRQRVAVARALAASRTLLLDEPTSAQDPEGAHAIRAAVRDHADGGGGALLVAHRPEDAYAVTDRLVVLQAGQVIQAGIPVELATAPASRYVAQVVGATVLAGHVWGGVLAGDWGRLTVPDGTPDGPAAAVVRPGAVTVHRSPPADGSSRNVLAGTVQRLLDAPTGVTVHVASAPPVVALLTHDAVEALDLRVGEAVWASVKANDLTVVPR